MADPAWIRDHGFHMDGDSWHEKYITAQPFPHIVIDNFLPSDLAKEVLLQFPALNDDVWRERGSHFVVPGGVANKYELGHLPSFPAPIKRAFEDFLLHPEFVEFVSKLTGIPHLYADSDLKGGSLSGGLNAVEKGGSLIRHSDFNFSSDILMYRAVNVLLYLNQSWSAEDGGNLDLWDKDLQGPPKTIISSFNRCLIFATNSETFHGYNKVTTDKIRRSINLYLYTKEPAARVGEAPHKTIWRPID